MLTLNGLPVNTITFPDQTVQVRVPLDQIRCDEEATVEWIWDGRRVEEVLQLVSLAHTHTEQPVVLRIPFLPYARQDQAIGEYSYYGLRVFMDIIQAGWGIKQLEVMAPHCSKYLLNQLRTVPIVFMEPQQLINLRDHGDHDLVIYPDESAECRLGGYLNHPDNSITVPKERDIRGEVVHQVFNVDDYPALKLADKVLIVDDICDGGATFINLIKPLADAGIVVDLYTTHAIYSKGMGVLYEAGVNDLYYDVRIKL